MSELADLLPRMRSAYEIFAEELEKHLEFLLESKEVLAEKTEPAELEEVFRQRAKGLEQRFHVLKGGAGFLKIKQVADLSDEFEKFFKKGELNHSDSVELKSEFSEAVEVLQRELHSLQSLLEETSPENGKSS